MKPFFLFRNNQSFFAYLALACVCFFWGTTFLAIRIGVQTLHPLWLIGIRQTLAGLLICGYFLVRGHSLPSFAQFKTLLITSLLIIILGNGVMSWSEVYIPSGLAALLCALVPFWMILFNRLLGSQPLRTQTIWGLIIGLAGLTVIFFDNLKDLANPAYRGGILAILIATAGWAGGTIYLKSRPLAMPTLLAAGWQLLLAGLVADAIALFSDVPFPTTMTIKALGSLIYLILFGSILAYGAYVYTLSRLPTTLVSLYAYLNPVVATVLGWLLLDEKLNAFVMMALALILLGVYLVNRSLRMPPKPVISLPDVSEKQKLVSMEG